MAAVTGAVAAVGGAALSYKGAKDAAKDQRRASDNATNAQVGMALRAREELENFRFNGPGGLYAFANEDGVRMHLGALEPSRQILANLAGHQFLKAQRTEDLPFAIENAGRLANTELTNPFVDPAARDLGFLTNLTGRALGSTSGQANDLLQNGFQRGLQNTAFGAAGRQLADADITGEQAREAALANFRDQARPGNERAVDRALTGLFSSGRLGTTGGANILGRLAEAQNQQDLGFQQASLQEGRAAQQQAAGLASQFGQLGGNVRGLEDTLLGSAFGRFSNTLGLAGDLNQQRFARGLTSRSFLRDGLGQNLQNAIALEQIPLQLADQRLQFGGSALGLESGLRAEGMNAFQAALNLAQSRSNAQTANASNIAQLAINRPQTPSPLTAIGGALQNNAGSIASALGGLFGGGSNWSAPSAPVANVTAPDGLKYWGAVPY